MADVGLPRLPVVWQPNGKPWPVRIIAWLRVLAGRIGTRVEFGSLWQHWQPVMAAGDGRQEAVKL